MRDEIALLILAPVAFYGYYPWSDPAERGWICYVCSGVLLAAFGWVFRRRCVSQAGIVACAITYIEGLQQAACGALTYGIQPDGVDVCRRLVPDDLYRAVGSLALAALLVLLWQPSRQAP